MIIQNKFQYQLVKHATQISMEILHELYTMAEIGIYPIEMDQKAFALCKKYNVLPAFAKVRGHKSIFGYAACIYPNAEAVHGIPSATRAIQDGDLLKIDFGIISESFYTDHCVTVGFGNLTAQDKKLLQVGKDSVLNGVSQAVLGNKTGDIGATIEKTAQSSKFDTIKHYIGHGIGHTLHELPEVPATGKSHTGTVLTEGMLICIEAQVVAGSPEIKMEDDGWTVKTRDGKNAVMFEYMTLITNKGPEILTDTRTWPLIKQ